MRWKGAAVAAAGLVLGACSIQPNSGPRDIPDDQRPPLDIAGAGAAPATGTGRVFLVITNNDEQEQLRSVLRNAATAEALLEALLDGPNAAELDVGLDTELPPDLTLNRVRQSAGTLTVDVSEEILALTSTDLRLAVAQIVFTGSELEGVRAVQMLVDGERREWPNGRGELQSAPLTVYDFPGLAESVQPAYPPVPSPSA